MNSADAKTKDNGIINFVSNTYPITEIIKLSVLHDSGSSKVFEIHTKNRSYILKLDNSNESNRRLINHAEMLQHLAGTGLSPSLMTTKTGELISVFQGQSVLVYVKVDGATTKLTPKLIEQMVFSLSKINSEPITDYKLPPWDITAALAYWKNLYANMPTSAHLPEHQFLMKIINEFPDIRELPMALIHGDPHAGNIIRSKNGYVFIDFSQGGIRQRIYDIAHVLTQVGTGYKLNFSKIAAAQRALEIFCKNINLTKQEYQCLPDMMDYHLLSHAMDWDTGHMFPENVQRYLAFQKRFIPIISKLQSDRN